MNFIFIILIFLISAVIARILIPRILLISLRKKLFDIPDDAKIRFNDSDIVTGGRGYNAWWSKEYERREADDL